MTIGNRRFKAGHTYIMGILNLTPDSFSDGGSCCTLEDALDRAEEMISDGADVIDIGGESTRPGYTQISADEEIRRIIPAVFAIKRMFDIPVSVDTYKAVVAEEALSAGADMINDIWGLRYPKEKNNGRRMADVIAESGAVCCIMHNREQSGDTRDALKKGECDADGNAPEIEEIVVQGFRKSLEIAEKAGILHENIILDPGIGFGKDYAENMKLMRNLDRVKIDDYPMLLGASRKSVIGTTLGLPAGERLEGTLATTAAAVAAGFMFARVHDIKENKRFIQMFEALRKE